jgi:hypothetical protein
MQSNSNKAKAHPSKDINIIVGKNLTGKVGKRDVQVLLEHIQALEELLDEDDLEDMHGTEGWRHHLGIDV